MCECTNILKCGVFERQVTVYCTKGTPQAEGWGDEEKRRGSRVERKRERWRERETATHPSLDTLDTNYDSKGS